MSDPRKSSSSIHTGLAAESAAANALSRRGFTILAQNWRTKWCEIDIVVSKNDVIWFVEVKYRATNTFGDGLEYIGPQKLRHMRRAAELWVRAHNYTGEYTLAAVAVTGGMSVGDLLEV